MEFHHLKSQEYSLGFEPLQVEEDDGNEEDEFAEVNTQTAMYQNDQYYLHVSSRSNSDEEDENGVDHDDTSGDSESSSESSEEDETSEVSNVDLQVPEDASCTQSQSYSVISKDSSAGAPQDVSAMKIAHRKLKSFADTSNQLPKQSFGLQKMPSHEFKFSDEIRKAK